MEGFKTASGKAIAVSEEAKERAKNVLENNPSQPITSSPETSVSQKQQAEDGKKNSGNKKEVIDVGDPFTEDDLKKWFADEF